MHEHGGGPDLEKSKPKLTCSECPRWFSTPAALSKHLGSDHRGSVAHGDSKREQKDNRAKGKAKDHRDCRAELQRTHVAQYDCTQSGLQSKRASVSVLEPHLDPEVKEHLDDLTRRGMFPFRQSNGAKKTIIARALDALSAEGVREKCCAVCGEDVAAALVETIPADKTFPGKKHLLPGHVLTKYIEDHREVEDLLMEHNHKHAKGAVLERCGVTPEGTNVCKRCVTTLRGGRRNTSTLPTSTKSLPSPTPPRTFGSRPSTASSPRSTTPWARSGCPNGPQSGARTPKNPQGHA